MELSGLLELDSGFVYSTNDSSIFYMLKNIEKGEFILNECDEKEIPLEITMYKIFRGLPINIISTAIRVDGKIKWNIVKGNNELRNIMKWINEDISITIQEKNVFFNSLNEDSRKYILKSKRSLVSTTIYSKHGADRGVLSANDLTEIGQLYRN